MADFFVAVVELEVDLLGVLDLDLEGDAVLEGDTVDLDLDLTLEEDTWGISSS